MTAYKISAYIPLDARRAACEQVYTPINHEMGAKTDPRAERDYCPLGIALRAMGVLNESELFMRAPSAGDFARMIAHTPGEQRSIGTAALTFMSDFDAGLISDLWDALGVEREQPVTPTTTDTAQQREQLRIDLNCLGAFLVRAKVAGGNLDVSRLSRRKRLNIGADLRSGESDAWEAYMRIRVALNATAVTE